MLQYQSQHPERQRQPSFGESSMNHPTPPLKKRRNTQVSNATLRVMAQYVESEEISTTAVTLCTWVMEHEQRKYLRALSEQIVLHAVATYWLSTGNLWQYHPPITYCLVVCCALTWISIDTPCWSRSVRQAEWPASAATCRGVSCCCWVATLRFTPTPWSCIRQSSCDRREIPEYRNFLVELQKDYHISRSNLSLSRLGLVEPNTSEPNF